MQEIEFRTADGMFIKQMKLGPVGTIVGQHKHKWDHTTLLAVGSLMVWADKQGIEIPKLYRAPAIIFIPRETFHKFQSMTDNVVIYCIHNLHGELAVKVLEENDLAGWELDEHGE